MLRRTLPALAILGLVILGAGPANAQPISADLVNPVEVAYADRVEKLSGKSILVFTPHPDDETFSMGGTLAVLAKNGNKITIVIYTNDNKGSLDQEMTSERLARIRRAEEEKACEILGIAQENIVWLGYEDGDLEYADPQRLRGEVARQIKIHRPDVVFSPDPGAKWEQWHKTDHRMSAFITKDAFIAAEWHLYYPQHLLDEKLQPYQVPLVYHYYSHEPNYEVDVTEVFDLKTRAAAAHVSQFEPSTSKYTPDMPELVAKEIDKGFRERNASNGRLVERFRREVAP
ncbi:MAG: PIG-L family deacetylase [Candidatus Hydrogenedentes bacterium]|nr:PIG-L family deacetylase [Candidatus Hydrogenedentota bacterium]